MSRMGFDDSYERAVYTVRANGTVDKSTNPTSAKNKDVMPLPPVCREPTEKDEGRLYVSFGPIQSITYLNTKIEKETERAQSEEARLDKRIDDIDVDMRAYAKSFEVEDLGDAGIRWKLLDADGNVLSTDTFYPDKTFELFEPFGTLTVQQLASLTARKQTCIVYQQHLYRLNRMANDLRIFTASVLNDIGVSHMSEFTVDMNTGEYEYSILVDERIEEIRAELELLHRTKVSAEVEPIGVSANHLLKLLTD